MRSRVKYRLRRLERVEQRLEQQVSVGIAPSPIELLDRRLIDDTATEEELSALEGWMKRQFGERWMEQRLMATAPTLDSSFSETLCEQT